MTYIWLLIIGININSLASFQLDTVSAKHIAIKVVNQPLRDVLQSLSVQSDAKFIYEDALLDGKYVTSDFRVKLVIEALHRLLSEFPIKYQTLEKSTFVLFADEPKKDLYTGATSQLIPVLPGGPRLSQPSLRMNIDPKYPSLAQQNEWEGRVELNLLITGEGEVMQANLFKSSGYPVLDSAAMEFASILKFDPALQGKEPAAVWIPWSVEYKLVENQYLPSRYLQRIQDYYGMIDQTVDSLEKSKIIQKILTAHLDYIRYLNENPDLNYNPYIRQIVTPEIESYWKDNWCYWPLHFLVFHDFILRFPDSEEVSYATSNLIYFMKKNVDPLIKKKVSDEAIGQKESYLKNVYTFLSVNYPQFNYENLEEEVMFIQEKNRLLGMNEIHEKDSSERKPRQ